MCTAVTYKTRDFYFGRTLDLEFSYGEKVAVTPRYYQFEFSSGNIMNNHYAMIGMAHIAEDYPLYYDAVNEKGLGIAGLNFAGSACYKPKIKDKDNIAQFEFIPWVLGQCSCVTEAKALLKKINITKFAFNKSLPPAQLHWLISDRSGSITVESVNQGLNIYDNPAGVLTNNPPFDEQMFHLNNYMNLSPVNPKNLFSDKLKLKAYSYGMGALGLPGDLSSQSRFVRAAFTKLNSVSGESEPESVGQFFHILSVVNQPRGCCENDSGNHVITIYSSCCNTNKGIYYYTTYNNHQITAVDMYKEELNHNRLVCYPVIDRQNIYMQN